MKIKSYIAVLLLSIFLVKFMAVDANGLNLFFSGSDITFVNPNCKKQNPPKAIKEVSSFSQLELSPIQTVALKGQCTTQFQLEPFSLETNLPDLITIVIEHFSARLSYLYLDNILPPPRLV